MQNFERLYHNIHSISAYKPLMEVDPLCSLEGLLCALHAEKTEGDAVVYFYTYVFSTLQSNGFDSLGAYLREHLLYDDTTYGIAAARGNANGALCAAARREIGIFGELAALSCRDIKTAICEKCPDWSDTAMELPEWEKDESITFADITDFYQKNGAGEFARYRAFSWNDRSLTPIANPDLGETELFGYEEQREEVRLNTQALIDGKSVNNMLLYGEAGTGKSATVKNLLNVPEFSDLRIIEIDKQQLADIPQLIRLIGGRRQKFILFVDDLSFESADSGYSIFKTVLEGSLEKRPENVVIYATSNRRHLMRETFSERGDDEVNIHESIQERTALSERFGIRVLFQGLRQDDYLALVENLAAQENISIAKEQLWKEAIQWEREHASRTPRAAQQFVKFLKSK